jgi:UDP-3-O-[3-hydroxymyristoyl] glucosamine N-acyltransferase
VTIGEECWIGACSTVSNPVSVGGGSKVRLGAVVVEDLEPHSDVSGNYARPHRQFLKEYMSKKAA